MHFMYCINSADFPPYINMHCQYTAQNALSLYFLLLVWAPNTNHVFKRKAVEKMIMHRRFNAYSSQVVNTMKSFFPKKKGDFSSILPKSKKSRTSGLKRGLGSDRLLFWTPLFLIRVRSLSLVLPLPLFQSSHSRLENSCIRNLKVLVILLPYLFYKKKNHEMKSTMEITWYTNIKSTDTCLNQEHCDKI